MFCAFVSNPFISSFCPWPFFSDLAPTKTEVQRMGQSWKDLLVIYAKYNVCSAFAQQRIFQCSCRFVSISWDLGEQCFPVLHEGCWAREGFGAPGQALCSRCHVPRLEGTNLAMLFRGVSDFSKKPELGIQSVICHFQLLGPNSDGSTM